MSALVVRRLAAVAVLVTALSTRSALAQYTQKNLVSDDTSLIPALFQDPNLVNPWGISASPAGPFWVSNNHSDTTTLYNTAGAPQSLVVTVPGGPTGQVFSGSQDFKVDATHPARFIFASEDGTISGWNPQANLTNAIVKAGVPGSGAVYKGLGIANNGVGNHLYAADFANGKIDVFDAAYNPVSLSGAFTDPGLPSGYAPFNIQNLGGKMFVTYAKQQSGSTDEAHGTGFGIVSVFDANGNFLNRLATGSDAGGSLDDLNAPWGLAIAPSHFGALSNDVLVGNFGSGEILAFDQVGNLIGTLNNSTGDPIVIEGLWGLIVGNGGNGGKKDTLYFTAGPGDEQHGLFGSLAVPEPGLISFAGISLSALAFLIVRRRKA